MPSLKDMRVRITATKATQKITKAMQMVAASKLRRAQAAAEAARPYAERMEEVLSNIAASVAALDSAPALLRGTGRDQVHLLVVCTAERGLCGPFNSAIVRLARERANAWIAEGKDVKFFCVGRKGYEQLRRQFEKQIIDHIELRAVRTLGFEVTAGAQVVPEFRGCDGPVVGQVVEGSVVLPDELAAWAPPGGAADHQGGAVRVRGRRGGDGSAARGCRCAAPASG